MTPRLRRLVRLVLEGYAHGGGRHPGILLGSVLLGTSIPLWAADAPPAEAPASNDAVVTDAAASNDAVVTDAVVTEATEAAEPTPDAATAQPATPALAEPVPEKGKRWALAPVRWGGTLSAGFRRHRSDFGTDNEQTYEGRLRANTYLVQPWIARVSTDLGITTVRAVNEDEASPAANNLKAATITGNATLNLFPVSRFPFQASLSLSDSRSDGTLSNSDYTRQRLSLRQEYRPERGNWRASGQYDHSLLSGSFGDDTVDRLGGNLTYSRERHSVTADGSFSRASRSGGASAVDLIGVGRHTFRYSDALSVETMATMTNSDYDLQGIGSGISGETSSFQTFSFASWAPSDSPWRATGTGRFFHTESSSGSSSTSTNALGGTGSLSYQANRNLMLFGTLSLNTTASEGSRATTSSQGLGLSYSGDPLNFGNFSYNWYSSANFSNAMGGDSNQRALTGTAGHTLQRDWSLSERTSLNAMVGQSITNTHASGDEALSASTLSHTAGISLRAMPTDGVIGYLGFNVSDSRTRGDLENSFRLYNVQLSGSWRISAYADFNANLTWQKTQQSSNVRIDPLLGTTYTTEADDGNVSGGISFNHGRVFGVRDLRYTLSYVASDYQTDSRLNGNPDATREQVTRDLDQRLHYRIGRLRAELILRQAVVDGKKNALLFFKVSRDFGAF